MEKEGRGQERPQSWKCSSVGMGSKMEVVLTVPHISHRTQGEGVQGGLWEGGLCPHGRRGENWGLESPSTRWRQLKERSSCKVGIDITPPYDQRRW